MKQNKKDGFSNENTKKETSNPPQSHKDTKKEQEEYKQQGIRSDEEVHNYLWIETPNNGYKKINTEETEETEEIEYEKFCEFTDNLTDEQLKEIVKILEIPENYEVITPDIEIFLYLTISPDTKGSSPKPASFVANLTYDPKSRTFEHHIINSFNKEWCESRKAYWEDYHFILPLNDVVEIYSRKGGKSKKKARYYSVCFKDEDLRGIKRISKRKAYKMAIIRADIVRILSY